VVHRLDKDTSGVVIFAKTDLAYLQLIKMFASRAVRKAYRAIVCGTFVKNFGKIDLPIGRNRHVRTKMAIRTDGKGAVTEWNVLETLANRFTHLQLHILTGRTHQIRVHMAYLGHPIVGDVTYGYGSNYDSMKISPRVMLHASKISLSHPLTGEELTVSAPLPQDFLEVLGILSAGTPPSQNRRR
jgi:23S rRNA pseudouridine1911/1915/1917 synthase